MSHGAEELLLLRIQEHAALEDLPIRRHPLMASDPQRVASLIASVLEIVSAFLLAVEAIKLDNLARLRTSLFGNVIRLLTPKILLPAHLPEEEVKRRVDRASLRAHTGLSLVGALLLAAAALAAGITPADVWARLSDRGTALGLVLTLFVLLLLFMVGGLLAVLLYHAVLAPFRLSFGILERIERHTEKGAIGILGFALFLIGAGIHAYLNWTRP